MGYFDGLKDAQVFEGGNYLGLGVYDLQVVRCLIKPSRASGPVFIAELLVLSSTNPDQPTGATVTFGQKMSDQAIAFAAIKEFVIALYGFDLKKDAARIKAELDPQIGPLTDAAVSQQNFFAGRCAHAATYKKTTKGKGIEIILPRWSPFEGEVPAMLAPPPQQGFGSHTSGGFSPQQIQAAQQSFNPPAQPPYAPPVPAPAYAPLPTGRTPQQPYAPAAPPQVYTPAPQIGAPPAPRWDGQRWVMP